MNPMKEMFTSAKAPTPAGKIAQVSKDEALGIAYISGLISQKPDGEVVYHTSVHDQTELIFRNLAGILEDMHLTFDHIIKSNVFISDMKYFDEMNEVYMRHFDEANPPARQCVTAGIWGGLDVEISFVATLR